MRVAVVGGGVVGLCMANTLTQRGADVVLLDAAAVGAAASAGNAGWISPSITAPLPVPRMMPQAIRWMFNPGSPLLVRPVLRRSYMRWLFDFWRNTRPGRYGAGLAAMVAIGERVLSDYEELAEETSFEMHRQGMLYVGRSELVLKKEMEHFRQRQMLGYRGTFTAMSREEALAHEPALDDGIAGAIFSPDDSHVRPESLTGALADHLRESGAVVREQAEVSSVRPNAAGWVVECGGGDAVDADKVVLACGVATSTLLRPHGIRLPLEGAKGYSITVEKPEGSLRGPAYLLESKVGVSPFDGNLRLAGTLELGSTGLDLNTNRLASIESAAKQSLRGWDASAPQQTWAGYRPVLPDGLPAIGQVPGKDGLFVAAGHSMLGITLAPTTAALLAPAILEGRPSLELAPFSLARFANPN